MGTPFKTILLALLVWGLATTHTPQAAAMEASALETLLIEEQTRHMPGLRAAVRFEDGRLVRAAVGLADREANVPLDDKIGMPGGSTGKTFAAALAMLLVEDGTLSLDDPASTYLGDRVWFSELPNASEIRVRHLLSHSAGIGDYPTRPTFLLSMIGRVMRRGSAHFEPEELIGFALGRRPLFAAGEGYHYTDIGYLVLGRLLEAAAGRDYYELLEERILHPLELEQVEPAVEPALRNIAIGYSGSARSLKDDGRMKLDPRSEWTGGGLTTNPTMLAEFYAALAEGRVVSRETVALMLDAGYRDPDKPWHYGFGLFVHHPTRSFGHAGLWSGYRSHVAHYRDTGITIAVQTNQERGVDLESIVVRIARAAEGSSGQR